MVLLKVQRVVQSPREIRGPRVVPSATNASPETKDKEVFWIPLTLKERNREKKGLAFFKGEEVARMSKAQ